MLSTLIGPRRRGSSFSDPAWIPWGGMRRRVRTQSGVTVDDDLALTYSGVWCATRIIAETLSMLPLNINQILPGGGEKIADHPLQELLALAPNDEMKAQPFREGRLVHQVNAGNGFAEIERYRGEIVALWPIHVSRVRPAMPNNRGVMYSVRNNDGSSCELAADEMLHFTGVLSDDGIWGKGTIAYARESIGGAMAVARHGYNYFASGAQPRGVVSGVSFDDPEERKLFRKEWKEIHGAPDSTNIAIMQGEAKYTAIPISNEDSQFLETLKNGLAEISRFYRVPLHMLSDLSRATFSNIEQQGIEFVMYTLLVWAIRIEQELNLKLLTPADRKKFRISHDFSALLRGDLLTRMNGYKTGLSIGIYTINQCCAKEGLPGIGPAGDVHYVPLNMTTAEYMAENPAPSTAGKGMPPDDGKDDPPPTPPQNQPPEPPPAKPKKPKPAKAGLSAADVAKVVLSDAVGRLATKEINAAKRQFERLERSPDKFKTWMAEFHSGHYNLCVTELAAAAIAMQAAGEEITADVLAAALIRQSNSRMLKWFPSEGSVVEARSRLNWVDDSAKLLVEQFFPSEN